MSLFYFDEFLIALDETIELHNSTGTSTIKNVSKTLFKKLKVLLPDNIPPTEKSFYISFERFLANSNYRFVRDSGVSFCINSHTFWTFLEKEMEHTRAYHTIKHGNDNYLPASSFITIENIFVSFTIRSTPTLITKTGIHYCCIELNYTSQEVVNYLEEFLLDMFHEYIYTLNFDKNSNMITLQLTCQEIYLTIVQELTKDYLQVWKNKYYFIDPHNPTKKIDFYEPSEYSPLSPNPSYTFINLKPRYNKLLILYLKKIYDIKVIPHAAYPSPLPLYLVIDSIPIKLSTTDSSNGFIYYSIGVDTYTSDKLSNQLLSIEFLEESDLSITDDAVYFLDALEVTSGKNTKAIIRTDQTTCSDIVSEGFLYKTSILMEPFYSILEKALDFSILKALKPTPTISLPEDLYPSLDYTFSLFHKELKKAYKNPPTFGRFISTWEERLNTTFRSLKNFSTHLYTINTCESISLAQSVDDLILQYRLLTIASQSDEHRHYIRTDNLHLIETNTLHPKILRSTIGRHSLLFLKFLPDPNQFIDLPTDVFNLCCNPPIKTYRSTIQKILTQHPPVNIDVTLSMIWKKFS